MVAATRLSASALVRRIGGPRPQDTGPAYRALADAIRSALLDGRLAVATRLPSERELAGAAGLSRTTVGSAYGLLREQGWLTSRQGAPSRLRLPDGVVSTAARTPAGGLFGSGGLWGRAQDTPTDPADVIELSTASLPAPAEQLTAAIAAALEELPRYTGGEGYWPFGLPVLRDVVAARYATAGVPTTADQILVTSGAQHAFSLVMGELSAPGDRVLVECPTYPVVLDSLRAGMRVPAPVGLGDPTAPIVPIASAPPRRPPPAWDVELVGATIRQIAPRLAYVIADHQNPTGALMPADTRSAVVAAAAAGRATLVVDESFRDVPFPGEPALPPPVAALDAPDGTRVVSLGSVSKSFWGGLRVGWIRAAAPLVQRLAAARALGDMAGPVLDQLVAATLLADPEPALAVQRARLDAGAAALRRLLADELPTWQASDPRGGTTLWVRLPGPFATDLALLAASAGVRIVPGPRFGPDGTMESFIRLPFTAPPELLAAGVRRLAAVAPQAERGVRAALPGWLA